MGNISKNLENEILEKVDYLNKSMPQTKRVIACSNRAKKAIEKNAQIHSYKMEYPKKDLPFSISRNNKKRDIQKGIKQIQDAFNWGVNNFTLNNLNQEFLKEINGRIVPEIHQKDNLKYRENGTAITGASVTPPYPFKMVNYEMPKFIESLKNQLTKKDTISKIESSIFSHFHLVRIHPFKDGNGRTARVLQDIILDYNNIPVPVIDQKERSNYGQILDNAVVDWKREKGDRNYNLSLTEGEKIFYDFIAEKINNSLDHVIEACKE